MKPIEGKDYLYIPLVPLHGSVNSHYGKGTLGSLLITRKFIAAIPFKIRDPHEENKLKWIWVDGHSPVEWTEMFLEQGTFDLDILHRFIKQIVEKVPHSRLLKLAEQVRLRIHQGWFSQYIQLKTQTKDLEKYKTFPIQKNYITHCINLFKTLPNYSLTSKSIKKATP